VPPSTDSGGSLPSSIASACLARIAPRDREWSKLAFPSSLRSGWSDAMKAQSHPAGRLNHGRHDAGWSLARQRRDAKPGVS
jgi:hypothetical protein